MVRLHCHDEGITVPLEYICIFYNILIPNRMIQLYFKIQILHLSNTLYIECTSKKKTMITFSSKSRHLHLLTIYMTLNNKHN